MTGCAQNELLLDGYARPFTTAPFLLDCWLPVIRTYDDWSKFFR